MGNWIAIWSSSRFGLDRTRCPVYAVRKVLEQSGMTLDDIDVIEINEAFAAQVLASADKLGIDMDKLNPHCGAIALGHPFGMTGARIMGTLSTVERVVLAVVRGEVTIAEAARRESCARYVSAFDCL